MPQSMESCHTSSNGSWNHIIIAKCSVYDGNNEEGTAIDVSDDNGSVDSAHGVFTGERGIDI